MSLKIGEKKEKDEYSDSIIMNERDTTICISLGGRVSFHSRVSSFFWRMSVRGRRARVTFMGVSQPEVLLKRVRKALRSELGADLLFRETAVEMPFKVLEQIAFVVALG